MTSFLYCARTLLATLLVIYRDYAHHRRLTWKECIIDIVTIGPALGKRRHGNRAAQALLVLGTSGCWRWWQRQDRKLLLYRQRGFAQESPAHTLSALFQTSWLSSVWKRCVTSAIAGRQIVSHSPICYEASELLFALGFSSLISTMNFIARRAKMWLVTKSFGQWRNTRKLLGYFPVYPSYARFQHNYLSLISDLTERYVVSRD